jgi:hypothetical protein
MRGIPAVRLLATLGAFTAAALLPLAAASQPESTRNTALVVRGTVKRLSADGHLVAFDVARQSKTKTCHTISTWRGAGKPTAINAGCVDRFTHDQKVTQLALAGGRLLWVDYQYGIHAYCTLRTATRAAPRPVDVDVCDPFDSDTFIGGIAGDGQLLVFNSWYDENQEGRLTDVTLWRLVGTKARKLLAAKNARTATSVSAGRIAVLEPGGNVAVYTADGTLLQRSPPARSPRLDGDTLVVRKGNSLQSYDVTSGMAGERWPLRGGKLARLEDVQNGIAVYLVKRTVHLLRLSDGRDVVIRKAQRGKAFAQLEPAGLFYANGSSVSFIPMVTVRSALG